MKKAIETKREKLKWLAALCLCLLCFSFCLHLLARPVLAATGLVPLADVELLGSVRWSGVYGENKDSFGDVQADSCAVGGLIDAPGIIASARYKLDKKFDKISGTLACADAGTDHAAMRLKLYADNGTEPVFTSAPILRSTRPFAFSAAVAGAEVLRMELVQMEVDQATPPPEGIPAGFVLLVKPMLEWVTPPPIINPESSTVPESSTSPTLILNYKPVEGWAGLYWQSSPSNPQFDMHVYSFTRKPETDSPLLLAYAKLVYQQKLTIALEDIYLGSYYGIYNNAELVLIGVKGGDYPGRDPITLGGYTFTPPHGGDLMIYAQDRVYTLPEAYEKGILRKEDAAKIATEVFGRVVTPDYDRLPPALELKIREAFLRDMKPAFEFYVNALNNNVYVRLNRDGTADFNDAIWAGPDRIIGTADDKAAVLRAGSFFYEEKPGEWKFLVSRFDYVDPRWAGRDVTPTTAPTNPSTGVIETTTDDFFVTGDPSLPPKTGVPFGAGLLICVAVLFMGCVYCGYRVIKKEKA